MNRFTEETNDFLVGIMFNNNKEWFHKNKEMYREYVHEPMTYLAKNLADRLNLYDSSQILVPRVSRANRDVRFSSNKMPYKVSKWFFLRTNPSSRIRYENPTIFFEARMEKWSYGFYYSPSPRTLESFRNKLYSNFAEAERIVDIIQGQNHFLFEGEDYKRIFNNEVSDKVNILAQKKWFSLTRYEEYDNLDFYSEDLCDIVFDKLKDIYPIYDYINNHGLILE